MSNRSQLMWGIVLAIMVLLLAIALEFFTERPTITNAVFTPTPVHNFFQLPTSQP